jgi:hypothetical protein
MDRPWWALVIKWTVSGLFTALIMRWLAKSRLQPRPLANLRQLAQPRSSLILGGAVFLFSAGLAVVSNVYSNKTTTWWTTSIFVGFALLCAPMIAGYFLARHDMSEDGLSYCPLMGPRRFLRWSHLRLVKYAPVMKHFRLETHTGEVARISAVLIGLPEFARLLLAHTPTHVIEADTALILNETANGNPPAL